MRATVERRLNTGMTDSGEDPLFEKNVDLLNMGGPLDVTEDVAAFSRDVSSRPAMSGKASKIANRVGEWRTAYQGPVADSSSTQARMSRSIRTTSSSRPGSASIRM